MTSSHFNNLEKNTNNKVLTISHLLHPYVKQRIRVGENSGFFPKRMYQSNEIIDDVILSVYEHDQQETMDLEQLRVLMFDLINKKIKKLFEDEKWHKKTISTKFILEEELNRLEEEFTVNADNDLIMNEDLDDISYHQVEYVEVLPFEDKQDILFKFLDIKDGSGFKKNSNGQFFAKSYYKLPIQTSNIVDLYILGKLNIQEIGHILELDVIEVKRILDYVKKKFMKNVN